MSFGINLRGDLAKLSDAELAARLQASWQAFEAAEMKMKGRKLWWAPRCPIRHPWAYQWLSMLGISGPGLGSFVGWYPASRWDGVMAMHLARCEIQDIHDEIERRQPPGQAPREAHGG